MENFCRISQTTHGNDYIIPLLYIGHVRSNMSSTFWELSFICSKYSFLTSSLTNFTWRYCVDISKLKYSRGIFQIKIMQIYNYDFTYIVAVSIYINKFYYILVCFSKDLPCIPFVLDGKLILSEHTTSCSERGPGQSLEKLQPENKDMADIVDLKHARASVYMSNGQKMKSSEHPPFKRVNRTHISNNKRTNI